MIWDYIVFAMETFTQRKKRTFLTLLGIFIGIATIVSLVSLGQGLEKSVEELFSMMGSDKIFVYPGASAFGSFTGTTGAILDESDLKTIRNTRGIDLAAPMAYRLGKVKFKDETKYSWVIGFEMDESFEVIESMESYKVTVGRQLRKQDKYKAVIGVRHYEADFFEDAVNIRDSIEIEGQKFKVIGVIGRIGNPEDDSQIYIPIEVAKEIFEVEDYGIIMAQAYLDQGIAEIAERLEKNLRRSRDVKEDEEDFTVQTSEELMESFDVIITVLQAVLIGIAAISLMVGGIGIMNTMYTSVLQRTKIIGVMKAIGATNYDVMFIFLVESGILGLIGGIFGIAVGVGVSKIIESFAFSAGLTFFKVHFPLYLILGALVFSCVIGIISGLSPAYRASKLKIADVLRYE